MKYLIAIVIALFIATPVNSSITIGGVGIGGWATETEILINVDGMADPFDYIMGAIIDRIVDTDNTCDGVQTCWGTADDRTIQKAIVVGDIDVTIDDFYEIPTVDNERHVGIYICPSNEKNGNYPVPYGGGTSGGDSFIMNFNGQFELDLSRLNVDVTLGAEDPGVVVVKIGCAHEVGYKYDSGAMNPGVAVEKIKLSGSPRITFLSDSDATLRCSGGGGDDGETCLINGDCTGGTCSSVGWAAGHIPVIDSTDVLHGSVTSSIAVWEDSVYYSDLSEWAPSLQGNGVDHTVFRDNDNIGYMLTGVGFINSHRGRMNITRFGVGVYSTGNHIGGGWSSGQIEDNNVNVVIGEPYTGSVLSVSADCAKGGTSCDARGAFEGARRQSWTDITMHNGNDFGGVVIFNGTGQDFIRFRSEGGGATSDGHSFIVGAGTSDFDGNFRPCVFDTDHGGAVCNYPSGDTQFRDIKVTGAIAAQKDSEEFDDIIVGKTFGDTSGDSLQLWAFLAGSDVDPGEGDDYRMFNHHSDATGIVDITHAWVDGGTVPPPEYAYVRHQGAVVLHVNVNDEPVTAGTDEALSFTTGLWGNTSYENTVNMIGPAGSSMSNSYYPAYLSMWTNDDAASTTGCSFSLRSGGDTTAPAGYTDVAGSQGTITWGNGETLNTAGEATTVPLMELLTANEALALHAADASDCSDGGNFMGTVTLTLFPVQTR